VIRRELRGLVRAIALLTAVAIAVSVPLGYSITRYLADTSALDFKAGLNAARVAQFIYGYPKLWQYQGLRISEIILLPGYSAVNQRVIDTHGRIVADEGPAISFPRLQKCAPIEVAGERVGELVVSATWVPALIDIGFVALASLALASLTYFAICALPLSALDRAFRRLAIQETRFKAALDNMAQGLCMVDAGGRIVVLNERFGAIFGLRNTENCVNAPPEQLLETVLRAGSMDRQTAEMTFRFPQTVDAISTTFSCELADDRALMVSRHAVESGGWVTTFEDVTEQRKAEALLDHMALHDSLTGLPNRTLFQAHLERHASPERGGFAVLFLDIDRFKQVNETLGHSVGDALLLAVADRLKGCLAENDILARLGGDEFAIIQPDANQPDQARTLAHRLVETLSVPYQLDGHRIMVSASVGVALAPTDGESAEAILKAADIAMCHAQGDGRGTYRLFEPAMDAAVQARHELEIALRDALANDEFRLHFQPLVELQTGRVASFEALLRWQRKSGELVPPDEFVPLAEEIGLIIPIGDWIVRAASAEAAKWPSDIKVAVNLSVVQFRNPNLVASVQSALALSGLAAHRLELEITESVLMHKSKATLATLRRLRALGLSVAMDDFGDGYSSLSYLSKFPFDKIKIGKNFVHDIDVKSEALAVIRAVVHLGRALGIPVTAEGVETRAQLDRMRLEGFAQCQGYLFSRPLPPEQIAGLIERLSSIGTEALPQQAA
jgi:diguanylate cyclase (GGDEF)-like protein/PAS domain S-box-containing protein